MQALKVEKVEMYCLRLFLPILLFNAVTSPLFTVVFLVCFGMIHKPCMYCTIILFGLFQTSLFWSDRPFLPWNGGRVLETIPLSEQMVLEGKRVVGLGWLRSLSEKILGASQWILPGVEYTLKI
ncbi:hypothetical protein G7K_0468-t1 [Saitoella complicata NRRL Y-17804]|uniref:Uncharacterized protein n=1 Tax=Saitoella complicata (strain BCRC 22490 / CBS 7301 / JCM 7358 / NBRC 10748 / NRRL Y-17804) TaxID=698492 RepID=A0A0E9N8V4_SAICN|nr:hypothetical protein G7K_0468-t1 [Saitoella complicata NRRL Y-17804]